MTKKSRRWAPWSRVRNRVSVGLDKLGAFGRWTKRAVHSAAVLLLPRRWAAQIFPALAEPPDTEAYPKKQSRQAMSLQVGSRWVLTLGPVILAAWISLDGRVGDDGVGVASATQNFLRFNGGDPYWSAIWFWALAFVWTRALFIRLDAEDRAEQEHRANLVRTLYRLPNLNLLWGYDQYYDKVADIALRRELPTSKQDLRDDIQLALAVLAEMAKVFSRNTHGAYGASVMLAVGQDDVLRLPPAFRTPRRDTSDPVKDGNADGLLRFADYQTDITKLDGLLVLPEDLALRYIPGEGAPTKVYPLLTLPIRQAPEELVLPGPRQPSSTTS